MSVLDNLKSIFDIVHVLVMLLPHCGHIFVKLVKDLHIFLDVFFQKGYDQVVDLSFELILLERVQVPVIDYELQMLSGQVLLFYFHVSFECSAHDRDKHVHHCHENDECSQNKECPSDVELRLVAL